MSVAERLSRGVKASILAKVVYAVSNAVLILVLTRYLLTPGEFGLLQFALSVLGTVAIFGSFGLPKSTARYVTEYLEREPSQVKLLLRRSTTFVLVSSALVGGLLFLGSGPLARLLGESRLVPFLAVGVGFVALRAISDYLSLVFQGFNRVPYSALVTALSGVGRTTFAVAFVVAGMGALGALLGYVVGYAVAVAVGGYVLYAKLYRPLESPDHAEPGLLRRLLEYSVPLTATKGAAAIDNKVDSILVGVLLNPTAVGFYAVARQVTEVVTIPAASFGFTLSPTIGEQWAQDSRAAAARLYEKSLTTVLAFYVPAAVGLVFVARPAVVTVFGTAYAPAVPVLQVLAVFVVVHSVNKITSDGLDYLGRARSRAVAKTLMAVSNFGLNLLLIPAMGVTGAAVATVLTYSAYTLFNVYTIHQELSLRVGAILRRATLACVVAGAMAAPVEVAAPYVSGLPSLLAVVIMGAGIWVLLAHLSGILDVRSLASYL